MSEIQQVQPVTSKAGVFSRNPQFIGCESCNKSLSLLSPFAVYLAQVQGVSMEQSWLCTAGAHSPHKPALSGWGAAGASPAGRHQDAPCDGHKGGQLNRLCGEKAFFLN